MKELQALNELFRIKDLSAFNVEGYKKKTKANQHMTRYYFEDGSYLYIYATTSRGVVFYGGQRQSSHFLKINK